MWPARRAGNSWVSFDVNSDRPIECRATAKLASQGNKMFLSSLNGLKLVKTLSLKFCNGGQFSLWTCQQNHFLVHRDSSLIKSNMYLIWFCCCCCCWRIFSKLLFNDTLCFSRANQVSAWWPLFADVDVQIAAVLAFFLYRVNLYFKCACVYVFLKYYYYYIKPFFRFHCK